MPVVLAFAWAACALVARIRHWQLAGGLGPRSGLLRHVVAGFPILLFLGMALFDGHRFWFHLPRPLLSPWLGWGFLGLWALIVLRNLVLLARMAMADRRLRAHAWRLEALEEAPWLEYRELVARSGLRRAPSLLGSHEVSFPLVVGLLPPAIILPLHWLPPEHQGPAAQEAPGGLQEAGTLREAVAHELVHIASGDILRRGLSFSLCLFLPLEFAHLPLRVDWRRGRRARGIFSSATSREFGLEEDRAQVLAASIAQGRDLPADEPRSPWSGLLVGGTIALLVFLAPGSVNAAYALGRETAIPQLLPRNWALLSTSHWKGSYGFIPAGSKGDACILLEVQAGQCALGQTARVQPESLKDVVRLEFEVEVETRGTPLPRGSYAGFLLRLRRGAGRVQHLSWRLAEDSELDAEDLGRGLHRFRNGVDLDPSEPQPLMGTEIQILLAGPGTYRVYAPRMWCVMLDGTRRPFG